MGCFKSGKAEDPEIVEHDKRFLRSKKLLLLGTGESGKTTIIKQMKILHINGFSTEERTSRIPFILQNIQESIYDIAYNMDKLNPPINLSKSENESARDFVLNCGIDTNKIDQEYFDKVKQLWSDDGIQESFKRSNEYQLIDSASYFLDKIDEIRQSDYIPSTQDVLYCRVKTTGISEIEFKIPLPKIYGGGFAHFLLYDVGGQRGERKKWIQVFSGIDAILFLIAANDFDQTLREDPTKNRLLEAFNVYEDVFSSSFLKTSAFIVFLNKQDLFRKKIEEQGRKIEEYFPDFPKYFKQGEKFRNDYEKANAFLRRKVQEMSNVEVTHAMTLPGVYVRKEVKFKRQVYIHDTVAIDTGNIGKVFDSVQQKIIEDEINKFRPL